MVINQTTEHGQTVYKFEAHQTKYEVITRDGKEFTVFSKRKNASFDTQCKVYGSKEELAQRGKVFANFCKLI